MMPKPAFLTGNKPTRTKATDRAYLKGGFQLLARASEKMTGSGDVIEAFQTLFGDPNLVYRPATTRLYRQQIQAVIGRKLRDGELSRQRATLGFAQLTLLLTARRGPCPKRTSRGKLKTPTYAEFRGLVEDFARRLRLPGGLDRTDTVLSLLVKVGPYIGLRPSEWLTATIVDHNSLNVVNAKSSNGRGAGEARSIGLDRFPSAIITMVNHLIEQISLLFAETGGNWRQLLGRLGERLARACKRLKIRRWSLYTTRHVAMANWKRAGFSAAEIAALAGHISTRTARNHYAGGRYGWTPNFARARPDPGLTEMIVARNSVTPIRPAHNENTRPMPRLSVPSSSNNGAMAAEMPERVTAAEIQHGRASAIPGGEDEMPASPSDDAVSDTNEGPAFRMG